MIRFRAFSSRMVAALFGVAALAVLASGAQAQVTDPRVFQLEEQVRSLNGRVEEMNFLILELQEQLRRIQQDNEFRFQELEEQRRGDAGGIATPGQTGETSVATIIEQDAATQGSGDSITTLGAPEQSLGSIRFDANGNPINDSVVGTGTTAALPAGGADGLFDLGYELILSGDYASAEPILREHVANYPTDPRNLDARYWLGESLLGQGRHADAAEYFLGISRDHPDTPRAPEALLKLGVSLAGLGRRDVACSTFAEAERRYPQAEAAYIGRLAQERAAISC